MTDNLEAVSKAIAQQTGEDPAPAPIDVHRERLEAMVNTAAAAALDHGRTVREKHDALMRAIAEKRDTIIKDIDEYLQLLGSTMERNGIIDEALEQGIKLFSKSPLPNTIAGKPSRKNGGHE